MNLLYNNDNQVANYVKKINRKKVAVTAGAIGVGIALTVATGGLGAPVAMAIGGTASGAIMSGYDAFSSGQRGWALVGSIAKGAGTGALAGFIGGQFIGAGASVAANVTQSISNQVVRQVAKVGVESAVETAIDTGIDLAVGNQITGQTVAMNFAYNTFTNGAGSVSSKKGTKADVPKNKPKAGDVAVTKSRQSSTPVQQLALPGPKNQPLALPTPKSTPKTDFYVAPDGTTFRFEDIKKNIDPLALKMTQTVKNHAFDVATKGKYKGELNRPYVDSSGTGLLINEIINSGIPTKDKYLPNGWRWDVPGSFNGRSDGNFELVIDLDNNIITRFNFTR